MCLFIKEKKGKKIPIKKFNSCFLISISFKLESNIIKE